MHIFRKAGLVVFLMSCCCLIAQQATAGTIAFTGKVRASRVSATGKTTSLTFSNPWKTLAGGTDEYSGIPGAVSVTLKNFSFTGTGAGAVLTAPVVQLWKFVYGGKTYSFNLTSLDNAATTAGSIAMSGSGTAFFSTGQEPATWSLSGTGSKFSFRLSFMTTTTVPDGGSTAALFGAALIVIEAARRSGRRRTAKG